MTWKKLSFLNCTINSYYNIFDYSINIEDTFLMLYKTIECYYKKQNIKCITSKFINYSIHNNYDKFKKKTEDKITFNI